MSDVTVNHGGIASQFNIEDCVCAVKPSPDSAITQWVNDVILITNLSTSLMRPPNEVAIGQMLIATMVSSTENYFRTVLADLVNACPWTANNVSSNTIPFSAVHTFDQGKASFGLVEGVLFSSRGVIAREIKRFTKYKVADGSALAKSINSFDSVCSVRHAAVHWSGRFDTKAHEALELGIHRRGQHGVSLNLAAVQDALAACDFLVRTANQMLFDHTLDKWLNEGYIGPDVDDGMNKKRARLLSATFSEQRLKATVSRRIVTAALADVE